MSEKLQYIPQSTDLLLRPIDTVNAEGLTLTSEYFRSVADTQDAAKEYNPLLLTGQERHVLPTAEITEPTTVAPIFKEGDTSDAELHLDWDQDTTKLSESGVLYRERMDAYLRQMRMTAIIRSWNNAAARPAYHHDFILPPQTMADLDDQRLNNR